MLLEIELDSTIETTIHYYVFGGTIETEIVTICFLRALKTSL